MQSRSRCILATIAQGAILSGCAWFGRVAPPAIGPNDAVASSEMFRVVAVELTPADAEAALNAVVRSAAFSTAVFGLAPPESDRPLSVYLHPSGEAYRDIEEKLTGGAFASNGAFSHVPTESSHVALQPPVSAAVRERIGLPFQTLRLLAHEASHLYSYRVLDGRRPPAWIREGSATWIEHQTAIASGWIAPGYQDPWASTYVLRVRRLIDSGLMPPLLDLFAERFEKEIEGSTLYACRFLAFAYLKERRPAGLERIMGEAASLDDGPRYSRRVIEATERILGEEGGLQTLDSGFREFVREIDAPWDQRSPSLNPTESRWVQIAFPNREARAWRTAPLPPAGFRLAGAVEILTEAPSRATVFLGRTQGGWIEIAFDRGGELAIVEVDADESGARRATSLARVRVERLAGASPVEFEATIEANRARVRVGGSPVAEVSPRRGVLNGFWGVGVSPGTTAVWSGMNWGAGGGGER
jgi:hypothetical protein